MPRIVAEVVGHEGVELHVDDAIRRDAAVLVGRHRAVERVEDHLAPERGDALDGGVVAEDRGEVREQRRERRDHLHRVAVRLDERASGYSFSSAGSAQRCAA